MDIIIILAFITLLSFFIFVSILFYHIFNKDAKKDKEAIKNLTDDVNSTIDNTNNALTAITDGTSPFKKLTLTDENGRKTVLNPKGTACFTLGESIICDGKISSKNPYNINGIGLESNRQGLRIFAANDSTANLSFGDNAFSINQDQSTVNGDLIVTGNLKSKDLGTALDQSNRALTATGQYMTSQEDLANELYQVMQKTNNALKATNFYAVNQESLASELEGVMRKNDTISVAQEGFAHELNFTKNQTNNLYSTQNSLQDQLYYIQNQNLVTQEGFVQELNFTQNQTNTLYSTQNSLQEQLYYIQNQTSVTQEALMRQQESENLALQQSQAALIAANEALQNSLNQIPSPPPPPPPQSAPPPTQESFLI